MGGSIAMTKKYTPGNHPNSQKNIDKLIEGGKKTTFKSGEKAAEMGKKGGIASGISKRKRKLKVDLWNQLLASKVQSEDILSKFKAIFDVDEDEEILTEQVMAAAQILKAMEGDTQAFNAVYDRVDGKPIQAIHTTGGGSSEQKPYDLSKLSEKELKAFEYLTKKAQDEKNE